MVMSVRFKVGDRVVFRLDTPQHEKELIQAGYGAKLYRRLHEQEVFVVREVPRRGNRVFSVCPENGSGLWVWEQARFTYARTLFTRERHRSLPKENSDK